MITYIHTNAYAACQPVTQKHLKQKGPLDLKDTGNEGVMIFGDISLKCGSNGLTKDGRGRGCTYDDYVVYGSIIYVCGSRDTWNNNGGDKVTTPGWVTTHPGKARNKIQPTDFNKCDTKTLGGSGKRALTIGDYYMYAPAFSGSEHALHATKAKACYLPKSETCGKAFEFVGTKKENQDCSANLENADKCTKECVSGPKWKETITKCDDGYHLQGDQCIPNIKAGDACTDPAELDRIGATAAIYVEYQGQLNCGATRCKSNYYQLLNKNGREMGYCVPKKQCGTGKVMNIIDDTKTDNTCVCDTENGYNADPNDPSKCIKQTDSIADATSTSATDTPDSQGDNAGDASKQDNDNTDNAAGSKGGTAENVGPIEPPIQGTVKSDGAAEEQGSETATESGNTNGAGEQEGSVTVTGDGKAGDGQAKTDVKPAVTLTTEQSSALAVAATAAGATGTEKQQLADEHVQHLVSANAVLQEQVGDTDGLIKQQLETFDSAVTELESNDGDVSKLTDDQKAALVAVAEKYGKSSQTDVVAEATAEVVTEGEDTVETEATDETDAEAEAAYEEAKEKYNKAKENEQSTANKMLGAAGMGATGVGGAMLMSGLTEQNADADAERAMQAYLATFTCKFGNTSVQGGEKEVVIPGGNELIGLYGEYVALANDLKIRKTALGMKPGIESEPILESATSGLYDDVSTGKTSGAYASLARALMDPNGEDAKKWNEQRDKTQENIKTGGITAASGAGISLVGDITNRAVEKKKAEAAEKKAKEEASAN